MIKIRPTVESELIRFAEFENERDTIEYIIPYSIDKHKECFAGNNTVYLSIYSDGTLVGFFILLNEGESVEFRRVVITKTARGIGQQAILKMHEYCIDRFGVSKIWLDVFKHNKRARHVYSKLGYKVSGCRDHEKGKLIIMQRGIQETN
jgi:GNAT superfamily N-acetyltransferase